MANKEHLTILEQGVDGWNQWRRNNSKIFPDLRETDFSGMNLTGANFMEAYLQGAVFKETKLKKINFIKANLIEAKFIRTTLVGTNFNFAELDKAMLTESIFDKATCFIGARLIKADFSKTKLNGVKLNGANLYSANFTEARLREADLSQTRLINAKFIGADLRKAKLHEAYLTDSKLIGADLRDSNITSALLTKADLSNAEITGAKLYGTSRDDWNLDGIKCDYVYLAREGERRTPAARDFRPGEFEELYKQLPTFEYYFDKGITPIDTLVMDQVVQAINEKHPEFELKLDSFHSRGQPHAKFTVIHKDYADEAHRQIETDYEMKIKVLEAQRDQANQQLFDFVSKLINRPQITASTIQSLVQIDNINHLNQKQEENMGDTYNFKAGGDINFAKDQAIATINKTVAESGAPDALKTQLEELTQAVQAMIADMPDHRAKRITDKLAEFSDEVSAPQPDRKWYSVSGEGLIDAAKAVGSLGNPVMKLVKAIVDGLPA